jgi:hypothetical protein
MAKSKSKASATGKLKSARSVAVAKKKNKTQAPEELVKSFSTKYGKNMFSDDGLFFFTPGESARCGLLLQSQQWYLDKADDMGLKDCFVFTPNSPTSCEMKKLISWHRATWWLQIPLKFLSI